MGIRQTLEKLTFHGLSLYFDTLRHRCNVRLDNEPVNFPGRYYATDLLAAIDGLIRRFAEQGLQVVQAAKVKLENGHLLIFTLTSAAGDRSTLLTFEIVPG